MFRFAGAALLLGTALGSYDKIAMYEPETEMIPHSKIDLDMQEINSKAASGDFSDALFVYENGGGGKCSQDQIDDATAFGKPKSSGACFGKTTNDPVGNSLKKTSIRTLKGFATSGSEMAADEADKSYNIYKNYWASTGMTDADAAKYADTNVRAAFEGTGAFSGASTNMRAEVVMKGVAYQAVWMSVLYKFEDAIMDCNAGDLFRNDAMLGGDKPHAWDEAWTFYAGSLEGRKSAGVDGDGVMLMMLANKRCANFGTCKDGDSGEANVNTEIFKHANMGRDKILVNLCDAAEEAFTKISNQMNIPLIQGMLKYAYESDPAAGVKCASPGDACDKALAEGWAFAAAVLPRLNSCDSNVAKLVKDNLDVTAITGATTQASPSPHMKDGYAKLKEEVEKTYPCLGITCEDVGVYQSAGVGKGGMTKCIDPPSPATVGAGVAPLDEKDMSGAVVAAFAMVLLNACT